MRGRHALVVGADAYADQPLVNAVGDATRIATALRSRGFEVDLVLDPGRDALCAAIETFRSRTKRANCALVYLAGHAVERFGAGYFLPTDMSLPPTASGLIYGALGLNDFVSATDGAGSRVVVLDACRDWPEDSEQRARISTDLEALGSAERDWPDLLLAFATSATRKAGDGNPGEGSAFTASLCRNLLLHGLTADDCFRRVSRDVAVPGRQQPWTYSSLRDSLSFSDLPRFVPFYRLAVPNSGQLASAWSVSNGLGDGLVAGMGDRLAWRVDLNGLRGVSHRAAGRLVGASIVQGRLLLAEEGGGVFAGSNVVSGRAGLKPLIKLSADPTFGITSAADGRRAVHHGADHVTVLAEVDGVLTAVARHDVGFDVYCATFLPDGSIWVAGGQGRVCELGPSGAPRELCRLGQHVNALASSSDGDRVFAVGQHGLAVELCRDGQVVRTLLDGRPLMTAAGQREQLMQVCDDDVIRTYLFDPLALDDEILEQIEEQVGRPAYAGCAHSPTLPILAIGTGESTVLLLDSRDGQMLQEIDLGSGFTVQIPNLHFLRDDVLAIVDGRGHATFFVARWPDRGAPIHSHFP